jgi:hypothetical protein
MLKPTYAHTRTRVKIDVRDFPDRDEKGGDLYLQGWAVEVCVPGDEVFQLVPAEFIDASIQDDGKLPGQISVDHVIQHPKQCVAIEVERLAEALGLTRPDGVWTFAVRFVSMSGVFGAQEPYAKILLDLSKPGKTNVQPDVKAYPATRALQYGM